jgi:hypothetical protein
VLHGKRAKKKKKTYQFFFTDFVRINRHYIMFLNWKIRIFSYQKPLIAAFIPSVFKLMVFYIFSNKKKKKGRAIQILQFDCSDSDINLFKVGEKRIYFKVNYNTLSLTLSLFLFHQLFILSLILFCFCFFLSSSY